MSFLPESNFCSLARSSSIVSKWVVFDIRYPEETLSIGVGSMRFLQMKQPVLHPMPDQIHCEKCIRVQCASSPKRQFTEREMYQLKQVPGEKEQPEDNIPHP